MGFKSGFRKMLYTARFPKCPWLWNHLKNITKTKWVLLSAPFQSGTEAEWCSMGLVTTNTDCRNQSAFYAWLHLRLRHTARELSWGTPAISRFKSLIQIVSISLARTEGHLHFASRWMLYKKPQKLPCTTDRRAWRATDSYESTGSQGVGYTAERWGTQYT